MEYGDGVLNLVGSIKIPIEYHLDLSPEWIDIGTKTIAIMSRINCDAVPNQTTITNPSVRFYDIYEEFWYCWDLDIQLANEGVAWTWK